MKNNTASYSTSLSLQDMKVTNTHTLNTSLQNSFFVCENNDKNKKKRPPAILKISHTATAAATGANLFLNVVYWAKKAATQNTNASNNDMSLLF